MAEGFDPSSPQGFLMQTASAAAGTTVTVRDAGGNELLSETVPCSFSSVLVSTPDMKVGDTCTLVVGDTETEMTIDNASAGGGFGGFGGRGMHGGNGFGGGQMPGQGGFGRNGRAFEDGTADGTQNSESTQNVSTLAVTTSIPVVELLGAAGTENQDEAAAGSNVPPDMQNGNAPAGFPGNREAGGRQPPEIPEIPDGAQGGITPPELPQSGAEGDMPSDLPQGNMPDVPTNGENGDGTQSGIPQGGWAFGERQGGGNMRNPNAAMPGQENASQAADTGTPITAEELILLGISAIVLLAGCVIAACYKRRG